MSDTVQQIKDRLSIVDVVSEYVKLERAGSSLRARCPFHAERTPSFIVSPERGTYHCFGCGVGGDIFSFVEQIEGLDFKGALKMLAEKAGVQISYQRTGAGDTRDQLFELLEAATIFYASRLTPEARAYLEGRGLSDGIMRAFRLGWASDSWSELAEHLRSKGFKDQEIVEAGLGKRSDRRTLTDKFRNRIIFPIGDSSGRIVGFSGRIFGPHASPDAPKYLNSPETPLFHKSRILYGFDRAKQQIRKHNFAVLVEGQMDLLACHGAGWSNAVAVSGTAFTPEHAALVRRMTENIVLALDADAAGVKAAARAARAALLAGLSVRVARLPEGSDPADLIAKDPEEWRARVRDAEDIVEFLLNVLERSAKNQESFRRLVEAAVLPFLTDVRSPIAREQYLRRIAARLRVSEQAVAEAYAKMPKERLREEGPSAAPDAGSSVPPESDRVRQAYALLLWQRSLPKPGANMEALERAIRESAPEEWALMEAAEEREKEILRFYGEDTFGTVPALEREVEQLVRMLRKDRLRRELASATARIYEAEARGDEDEAARALARCQELTREIAKMHDLV